MRARTTPSRALRAVERDSHTSQKRLRSSRTVEAGEGDPRRRGRRRRGEQATFRVAVRLSAIGNSLIAHGLIEPRGQHAVIDGTNTFVRKEISSDRFV